MINFLKFIFYILTLFLIIISLYPGSLLGYLIYGDLSQQPQVIQNPFGTTINHFFYYTCLSFVGFFAYQKNQNFQKLVYSLFLLSVILEVSHFIIPNRSFQMADLLGNILGVLVAYFLIKIYLLLKS